MVYGDRVWSEYHEAWVRFVEMVSTNYAAVMDAETYELLPAYVLISKLHYQEVERE